MTSNSAVPAIRVVDAGYTFAGRTEPSLAQVSFDLPAGAVCVVTGTTGSGKSTLLRMLAGLIPHHASGAMQGQVELLGVDTRTCPPQRWAGRVGLLLQSPDDQLCTTSVQEEIAFGLENLALGESEIEARLNTTLHRFDFTTRRDVDPRTLSGGQKQRLLIASLLALDPQVLLLDEPLSQLDAASAVELLNQLSALAEQGVTIVVAEHRLDEVLPWATHLIALDRGRLVDHVSRPPDDSFPPHLEEVLAAARLHPPEIRRLAIRLEHPPCDTADALLERIPAAGDTKPSNDPPPPKTDCTLLAVQRLTVGYRTHRPPIVQDLTFAITAGERIALVGPNGAGKSTLLATLAGLLRPTAGTLAPDPRKERGFVGLMLQNPDLMLYTTRVFDELFATATHTRPQPISQQEQRELLGALNLDALVDELPQSLSRGQRLRVALAATVARSPQLLLLDEPTTGQDVPEVDSMLEVLSQWVHERRWINSFILATHDLRSVVRFTDRVLVIDQGRLVADVSPGQLLADEQLLSRAGFHLTPLLHVRRRLNLRGLTLDELADELASLRHTRGGLL